MSRPVTVMTLPSLMELLQPGSRLPLPDTVTVRRDAAVRGVESLFHGVPPCVVVIQRSAARRVERIISGQEMLAALRWAFFDDACDLAVALDLGDLGKVDSGLPFPAMPLNAVMRTPHFARWSRRVEAELADGEGVAEAGDRFASEVRRMAVPTMTVNDDAEDPAQSVPLRMLLANLRQG